MHSKKPPWQRWRKWKWLVSALLLLSSIAWAVSFTRSIRMGWSGPDGSLVIYCRQGVLRVVTNPEPALEDRQIDVHTVRSEEWVFGAATLRMSGGELRMSMWFPPLILLVPTMVIWYLAAPPPFFCCQSCGHDLRHWYEPKCPECGAAWTIPGVPRRSDGRCKRCRYDLPAENLQRCPQCGLGFDPDRPYLMAPMPGARWLGIVSIAVGVAFVIMLHQMDVNGH